jgi:hypothetical protein
MRHTSVVTLTLCHRGNAIDKQRSKARLSIDRGLAKNATSNNKVFTILYARGKSLMLRNLVSQSSDSSINNNELRRSEKARWKMKYEVVFRKHFSGSLNIAKINKPFAKIVIVVTTT